MNMGERLRELRLERNISQEEVAKHIGITRSAYSHYEINNRQPVYETLIKLASYFDVSLDYLIGGAPPRHKEKSVNAQESELLKLLKDMNQDQRQQSIGLLLEVARKEQRKAQTLNVSKKS